MAITLVGHGSMDFNGYDPGPEALASSITVQAGDIALFWLKQRLTFVGQRPRTFSLHGDSTASVGAFTSIFNNPVVTAFTPDLRCSWVKVTAGGTLKGQCDSPYANGGFYVQVWRGVDGDSPIPDFSTTRSDSATTNHYGLAVTPSATGDAIVSLSGSYSDLAGAYTATSGFTEISESGDIRAHGLEWRTAPSTSDITSQLVCGFSSNYVNGTVVLRAAPEVVPGTVISRGSFF